MVIVSPEAAELLSEYGRYIYDGVFKLNERCAYNEMPGYIDRQKISVHKLAGIHCIIRDINHITNRITKYNHN